MKPRRRRRDASENPSVNPHTHNGQIVGFRAWGLNAQYMLESPHARAAWPTEPTKATAVRFLDSAPGWYAYYTLAACDHREFNQFRGQKISGAIAAWGETFVYPTGFRAEYARVVALCYQTNWPRPFIAALHVIAGMYSALLIRNEELERIAGEFGHVLDAKYYKQLPSNMYKADSDW
jgi:hypothetical protein